MVEKEVSKIEITIQVSGSFRILKNYIIDCFSKVNFKSYKKCDVVHLRRQGRINTRAIKWIVLRMMISWYRSFKRIKSDIVSCIRFFRG